MIVYGQPVIKRRVVSQSPHVLRRPKLDLRWYSQAIVRWRIPIIIVWGCILLASIPFSLQVTKYLSTDTYSWSGSQSQQTTDLLAQKLGAAHPTAIVLFQSPTLTAADPAFMQEVDRFVVQAQTFSHVTGVTRGGVGVDGHSTFVKITFTDAKLDVQNAMPDLEKLLPQSPARSYLTGKPAVQSQITQLTQSDLTHAEAIALPFATIVLILVFGALVAASLPLLLAITALLVSLAIIFVSSQHTDMTIYVVNILSAVGVGISIDYTLFLVRRFRDELPRHREMHEAIRATLATAGEAVLFSGLTVIIGFGSLVFIGLPIMTSVAIGGAALILVAVLGALTLVPACMAALGPRLFAFQLPRFWERGTATGKPSEGIWYRWALFVMRRPWLVTAGALVLLGVLISPLFSIKMGLPGITVLPAQNSARFALSAFQQEFPQEQTNPVIVVLQTADGSNVLDPKNITALCSLTQQLHAIPRTQSVIGLATIPSQDCAQMTQILSSEAITTDSQLQQLVASTTHDDTTAIFLEPQDRLDTPSSKNIVTQARTLGKSGPFVMYVGGQQATSIDLAEFLYRNFPRALVFVFVATYLILLLMFRSVLLPLKAIILNTLSVAAAYGIVIWIFQQGHLNAQLQFTTEGYIEIITPILMFCILFGLSMDYEVFLLSRIREEWLKTRDNRLAVANGLASTAGIITSAAVLIVMTSGAFIFTQLIPVKEQGVGISVAVLLDATFIRILLAPATMQLMGRWNWWMPSLPRMRHREKVDSERFQH